jgi:hypothetical protein
MQLASPQRTSPVRARLGAAACMLLAAGMPAAAHADSGATNQLDASVLLYGEQNRARVIEPVVRVTRLFGNGQSLSASLGIDVITGSSPTGAAPSGVASTVQTTTTPSGGGGSERGTPADATPLSRFSDHRVVLDAEWSTPLGRFLTSTLGGHFSKEKDYQSTGANAKLSLEIMNRLTTITVGGGFNHDLVDPVGGTHAGLADGTTFLTRSKDSKQVTTGVVGVSRIVTRRWLLGVTATRSAEDGYLTDPYKVVSLVHGTTGLTTGQLTEKRPSTRDRRDVLVSSVYHLTRDVAYLSYRRYWDDWGVKSNTFDAKYRRELSADTYLEPHVRYYAQTQADFHTWGLIAGEPLPAFASADYRLGALKSVTLGATCGFRVPGTPGEWAVRGEYIRQFGDHHPAGTVGVQQGYDLFPAVNIGTLTATYSLGF